MFEKNEVLRQKLEYDLTLANQGKNKEIRKAAEDREKLGYQIKLLQGETSTISNVQLFTPHFGNTEVHRLNGIFLVGVVL